jgi:Spy/CpxP family protein refolding chaperone
MRRGERVAEKVQAVGTPEGREGLGACTRQARAAMSIVAVVEERVCWA